MNNTVISDLTLFVNMTQTSLSFMFKNVTYNLCLAEVGPKKILDLMSVPWLTRENVASHLQVYHLLICIA